MKAQDLIDSLRKEGVDLNKTVAVSNSTMAVNYEGRDGLIVEAAVLGMDVEPLLRVTATEEDDWFQPHIVIGELSRLRFVSEELGDDVYETSLEDWIKEWV